jgi:hypothetical protein
MNPTGVLRRGHAVTHDPDAVLRLGHAISRRFVATHITWRCEIALICGDAYHFALRNRIDLWRCISLRVAKSHRFVAMHIASRCEIASICGDAYHFALRNRIDLWRCISPAPISMGLVLCNDSHTCRITAPVGIRPHSRLSSTRRSLPFGRAQKLIDVAGSDGKTGYRRRFPHFAGRGGRTDRHSRRSSVDDDESGMWHRHSCLCWRSSRRRQ